MDRTFLGQLDERTQGDLLELGVRRRLPARSFIYFENDPASHMYVLEDGIVRIDKRSDGGQSSRLDLMMPGDVFGEVGVLEERPRSSATVTMTNCRMVAIPGAEFLRMFNEVPALARGTARWMSLRVRELADRFLEATHSNATRRVCARLVYLMASASSENHGPVVIVLPLSQADLAEWPGLSREATVKVLRELRDEGIVETSRGRVLVLQPDALRLRAAGPEV